MTSPVLIPAGHKLIAADFDAYENLTGAWTPWTPALGALTQGNGTITAVYRQVGKTVNYRFIFVLGSASAVGTNPVFTLPATPHADYINASLLGVPVGALTLYDSGTGTWVGLVVVLAGSSASMYYSTEVGSGSATTITATAPYTFTTNDRMIVCGTYEAA